MPKKSEKTEWEYYPLNGTSKYKGAYFNQDNSFLSVSEVLFHSRIRPDPGSLMVRLREASIKRGDWTIEDEVWWQKRMSVSANIKRVISKIWNYETRAFDYDISYEYTIRKGQRERAKWRRLAAKQRKKAEDLGMEYGEYLQIMKGWKKNETST